MVLLKHHAYKTSWIRKPHRIHKYFNPTKINNHTAQYYVLNNIKHKHTLTTLTGLAFLAGPQWN